MRSIRNLLLVAMISTGLMLTWGPAQAQLGGIKDKLKKKAEQKANQETDKAIDKTTGDSKTPEEQSEQEAAQPAAAGKGGTAAAEDMTLYTKYDFVPGDKVIFYDDLAGEEIGEFPSRWKLDSGVFEVAKQGGENYILCTDQGFIRPKVAAGPLPPKYTVEMEFYAKGSEHKGHWFFIEWVDAQDQVIGEFGMKDNVGTHLTIMGNNLADKRLPNPVGAGKHMMRIMATKSTIKCYLDNERVANVPAVEGFQPVGFRVHTDPWVDEPNNPMLVRGFRYAEGGKSLKEQLDEAGRIVTHGILFDSGSDKIRAESYKTLSDIGQLLTENAALRLSVEGHTDSDGADESNLTLSENRAKSVRSYLMETFKIDGARLESKGLGETKPLDTNDTPEGKANNRRVELVKI
jgi:outer membrane protein OmpA-like peptidoglycan-associated protein